jgi:hypothetical protein
MFCLMLAAHPLVSIESYAIQHHDGFIVELISLDVLHYREKEWLLMPDNKISSGALGQQTLVQWPLFLLANKVSVHRTSYLWLQYCLRLTKLFLHC